MRKTYIVKNQRDFTRIIKKKQFVKNSSFIIYYENNNLPYDRYGVSVGTKLGNAVFRNKFKRKIRAIVDIYKKDYINFKDYIIILRESGSKCDFDKLQKDFLSLIKIIRKDNINEKTNKKQDQNINSNCTTINYDRMYNNTN